MKVGCKVVFCQLDKIITTGNGEVILSIAEAKELYISNKKEKKKWQEE